MTQVYVGRTSSLATTAYAAPPSPGQWGTNEDASTILCRISQTLSDLFIQRDTAPGTGKSATFELLKNGVGTGVSVTISESDTEGTSTGSASYVDGDTMVLRQTTSGSPAASEVRVSIKSVSAESDESFYGCVCTGSTGGAAATIYNAVFSPVKTWSPTQHESINVVSAPGSLTRTGLRVTTATGGATTYILVVWKNGVRQDGSGGTVDTRLIITGSAVIGTADFDLPLEPGDYVEFELTWNGVVGFSFCKVSCAFTATTAGQSQWCGLERGSAPSTTVTNYQFPGEGQSGSSWSTVEANREFSTRTGFYLAKMRARVIQAAASDTGTWALSARLAQGSPVNAPSVTVGDSQAGADDVGSLSIGTGQSFAVRSVPSGSPGTHSLTWAFTQFTLAPVPVVPPLAPQAPCTPTSEVSGGGKGNSGCNAGGVGWESQYTGPYGTIPEHDDPPAGEALSGKEHVGIELWAELVHTTYPAASPATTTYLRAQVELADDGAYEGGRKRDGLLAVGGIENALGHEQGGPEAATVDVEYSCTVDETFKALLDDQEFEGDEVYIKVASDPGREAGTPPKILSRAIVEQVKYTSDLKFKLAAIDRLFSDFGPFGPDQKPWTFKDLGSSINAPADVLDRMIPILYGEKSDEGARNPITNALSAKGSLPGHFLGRFTGITGATTEEVTQPRTDILPTFEATIQQSFAQQRDLAGGTFTGGVTSVIVPIVGGLAGPISPPTSATDTSYEHGVSVFFSEVPSADEYYVFVFDGPYGFDPNTGTLNGSTRVRYKVHDNSTFDGQWVNGETVDAFRTDFSGWDDGENALETVTVSTEDEWGFLAFGLGPWFRALNVYGSDLGAGSATDPTDPAVKHDRVVLDLMGRSDILVPGYIWPFADQVVRFTNDAGEDFDIFGIYVKGPLLDDHVNGVVNITMNAIGTPHLTTSAGLPIIKAHHCEHHWIENHMINRWRTGDWTDAVTYPRFADGTPMVKSSTFIACQEFTESHLGGDGLTVGWYIDSGETNLQIVAAWMRETNTWTGRTEHGQIMKFWFDETSDLSAWDRVTHVSQVYGKYERLQGQNRQNIVVGYADWDPDKEKYRIGPIQEVSDVGVDRYKNRRKLGSPIESKILNLENHLQWVVERTLARLQYGTTLIDVTGPIGWLDRDVGEGILFTSELGPGASGYVDHPFIIMRKRFSLARRQVTYTLWDVRDVMLATLEDSALARLFEVTDVDDDAPVVTDDEDVAPLVI